MGARVIEHVSMRARFDSYRRGIAHEGFHPALGGVEHACDVVFVRAREIHGGRWSRARACAVSSLFREREASGATRARIRGDGRRGASRTVGPAMLSASEFVRAHEGVTTR